VTVSLFGVRTVRRWAVEKTETSGDATFSVETEPNSTMRPNSRQYANVQYNAGTTRTMQRHYTHTVQ
jgi:hypothetical protein